MVLKPEGLQFYLQAELKFHYELSETILIPYTVYRLMKCEQGYLKIRRSVLPMKRSARTLIQHHDDGTKEVVFDSRVSGTDLPKPS